MDLAWLFAVQESGSAFNRGNIRMRDGEAGLLFYSTAKDTDPAEFLKSNSGAKCLFWFWVGWVRGNAGV